MTFFGWDVEQFTTSAGETVFACGTGANELKHMLGALSYGDDRKQRERNPVAASLLSVMGITGVLLGEQIRIGKNIDAFFGGGFEIVTPSDGAMHPIPVTYLFLEATITASKEMTVTFQRVLTFDYLGDILLIYVLDPLIEDAKKEIYVLSPLYRSVTKSELDEFRRSHQAWPRTKLTCAYVYLPQAVEPRRISVQADFAGLKDPAVTIVEAHDMIELGLSEAWVREVGSLSSNRDGNLSENEVVVQKFVLAVIERGGHETGAELEEVVTAIGHEQGIAVLMLTMSVSFWSKNGCSRGKSHFAARVG